MYFKQSNLEKDEVRERGRKRGGRGEGASERRRQKKHSKESISLLASRITAGISFTVVLRIIKFILKQSSNTTVEARIFFFFSRNQMTSLNAIWWSLLIILPSRHRYLILRTNYSKFRSSPVMPHC